jgi:SAM-dependent methyltransferase
VLGAASGLDVIELGCGTAYFSGWLARRGARVVGVDITPEQLATARRCQQQFGASFPLIEAARLLRPNGRLVFLTNSLLIALCIPDEDGQPAQERLLRAQSAIRRQAWPSGGIEFHLAHGEWIALLRQHGFEIERLVEFFAPAGAADDKRYNIARGDWAQRWPVEEIWVARKR